MPEFPGHRKEEPILQVPKTVEHEKVLVNGVEYSVEKEGQVTKLKRYDPGSGFHIENIFAPKPDADLRLDAFLDQAAKLVIQKIAEEQRS